MNELSCGRKKDTCDDIVEWDDSSAFEDFGDVLGEVASQLVSHPFNLCTVPCGTFSPSFPLVNLTLYKWYHSFC